MPNEAFDAIGYYIVASYACGRKEIMPLLYDNRAAAEHFLGRFTDRPAGVTYHIEPYAGSRVELFGSGELAGRDGLAF